MEKTHWKALTNPDYLGAYAFKTGEERILTIKDVTNEIVVGPDGKKEECQVARFYEKEKPMILNKTNMKVIAKLYSSPYIEDWRNKKITVHVEKVKAFGEIVEALRVMKKVPKEEAPVEIKCEECNQNISAAYGMTIKEMAAYTKTKYGKALCEECAKKFAEVKNKESESVEDENNENQD